MAVTESGGIIAVRVAEMRNEPLHSWRCNGVILFNFMAEIKIKCSGIKEAKRSYDSNKLERISGEI